jgi:hypothetical protein
MMVTTSLPPQKKKGYQYHTARHPVRRCSDFPSPPWSLAALPSSPTTLSFASLCALLRGLMSEYSAGYDQNALLEMAGRAFQKPVVGSQEGGNRYADRTHSPKGSHQSPIPLTPSMCHKRRTSAILTPCDPGTC